jgi:phosphatidylethanolamine/phosphatidyl-N-methylethanolamine N-methyltransferase
MTLTNRWNRVRYRLYAPVYDLAARPLESGRRRAIDRLDVGPDEDVLVVGCGTGMDLDYLPPAASVTAVDLTETMVRRTAGRGRGREGDLAVAVADAHELPFADDSFDAVLLHLVLSVVPDPAATAVEAARVLAPTGRASIYDKFAPREGDPSVLRRAANPLARLLFADLNRPLEPMLDGTGLETGGHETFLGGLYTVTIARPS